MKAPLIDIAGVDVVLGGKTVVHSASLLLPAERFVVLVGPNGAGKTTLLRAVAGLLPSAGTIRIKGQPLSSLTRLERARLIAYLPQGHQVHWPLTAREIVALGRFPHGLSDPARMSATDAAIVDAAMARTETLAFANQPVQQLSGGERARVMLARVLAVGAPILLADEPTASLDPRHQIAMMRELQREARQGALVIAVTHDLGLAARLADDIMLMNAGRIIAQGAPRDVLSPKALAESYGIRAHTQEIDGELLLAPWEVVP